MQVARLATSEVVRREAGLCCVLKMQERVVEVVRGAAAEAKSEKISLKRWTQDSGLLVKEVAIKV